MSVAILRGQNARTQKDNQGDYFDMDAHAVEQV